MPTNSRTTKNRRILTDLLSLPTAPFAEEHIIAHVRSFCAARRVRDIRQDGAGNLLIHVTRGTKRALRPVCITSHMDHPGFLANEMTGRRELRASWHGGVPPEYFPGARVRFFEGGKWVRGRVVDFSMATRAGRERVDTATIRVATVVSPGAIGMWDFGDPVIRGSRIHARACDDLVGVGAMLCCIDELASRRSGCDAYFLFTRAEEVGFIGAIAAGRLGTIPRKCVVVAMEASSERKDAKMGDGPILRVGDRATCFTPEATAHCYSIARRLAQEDSGFQYQRKLMDGGTCESSAYCTLGYEATGLCVALGNYHNVDSEKRQLAPEYVDLIDVDNVVKWFVELADVGNPYSGRDELMRSQLKDLEKTYAPLLKSSVKRVGGVRGKSARPR